MEDMVEPHLLVAHDAARAAQLVGSSLQSLGGSRVLITGGTGFIGTWLLETLSWFNSHSGQPCTIYVPTRSPEAFARKAPHLARRPDIIFLAGDVRSFDYPARSCDFIIHAAAPADPEAHRRDMAKTIVEGTQRLLDLAVQKRVESFLFVSSGAVYGIQPPELTHTPEDYIGGPATGGPRSAYNEAKRYAETLCALYRARCDVPVRIARPFTLVGPYQSLDSGFAVTDFIREGLNGRPLRIQGDGATVRSYYYAADCTAALLKILLDAPSGQIYNVGSDEPVSILTLAQQIVAALDAQLEIVIEQPSKPDQLPARYVPDISRGKIELGLKVWTKLDEALSRTIAWFRSVQCFP